MFDNNLSLRQLIPVLFIVFIDTMGITIVIPIMPFYALAFNAPPAVVGLLLMSYALAQVIFAPILGNFSDRFGRKPVLALAQVGTFASLLLLGFAWALPALFLARILDGITGANMSTVQSAITDMTSARSRAKGLGLVGAAFGVGFIVGPLVSGLALRLAGNNYSAPAFVAAGFAFLSIMLTTFVFRETLPADKRKGRVAQRVGVLGVLEGVRSAQLRPFYVLVFAVQFIFAMFTSTFALFTLNRIGFNSINNAIFFGVFGTCLVLMQGVFVGRWVQRYGEYRVLIASFMLTTFGFGLAAFTPQQAVPWYSEAAMLAELSQVGDVSAQVALLPPEEGSGLTAFLFVLFSLLPGPLGFTLQLPTLNTLITKHVPTDTVGKALGMSSAFAGIGNVLGPLLGGWLFDSIAPGAPFAVNGSLSLVVLGILLMSRSVVERPVVQT
jgi:DHA1 family tetracycline resistance protein-like MFS transporter